MTTFEGVDAHGAEVAGRAGERRSATAERPWVRWLARAGFASKSLVYLVIGALALELALGFGGKTTDARGAVAEVASAPLGAALVALLAVGLAGLALWFLVDAIADPDRTREGAGAFGVVARAGQAVVALGYGGLAIWAVRLALGAPAGATGEVIARSWTARFLGLPGGPWLVGVAGALLALGGARQAWIGLRRHFRKTLDLGRMAPALRRWSDRLGTVGFAVQGVMWFLVGAFFVQAALEVEPHEATGFDGALETLARSRPLGSVLLATVALGLLAYAAFSVVEARYRRLGR